MCYNLHAMTPFLTFQDVHFQYPAEESTGLPALRGVSLDIEQGEFVAIIGANGSGKSTFARLAAVLLSPTQGKVLVGGVDTRKSAGRIRLHTEVGVVFQYPEDQIVGATVEEDVAFGPENLGLPRAEIRARVEEALAEVGLLEQRSRPPHMLSAGQTQRLALAGALAMRPRAILFDEASTMLDPAGRLALMDTMRRLNAAGMTILFITHFMGEASQAGRVIVFHQGQVAQDGSPREVFTDAQKLKQWGVDLPPAVRAAEALREAGLILPDNLLTEAELVAALPTFTGHANHLAADAPSFERSNPFIDVQQLEYVYLKGTPLAHQALKGVNFQAFRGRGHGLLGRTGSGKSTLLQHLNGLLRPQQGQVRVGAFDLTDAQLSRREVVQKVGLVFQNPEAQFFEHYVGDEIAFGARQFPREEKLSVRVQRAMQRVGLDFEQFKDRPLFALSGGERRKVALASTLVLEPEILLLDEPTAGLDPRSRLELMEQLQMMQADGMELVLSSHQMEDLAALAQDLTVFYKGQDVMRGTSAEIFGQGEELRKVGLGTPVAVRIADQLRLRGWQISGKVIDLPSLNAALRSAQAEGAA